MKRFNHIIYLFIGIAVFSVLSCTKYETPTAIAGDIPQDDDTGVKRRVLWINIDGAVGQIVKNNMPTTIKAMLPSSKYTFEALSDNRILEEDGAEDAINWTTLLTGMSAATHKVQDNSYIPDLDVDPNNPDQKVAYYPNIITLITESYPNAKTLCITPYRNLNGNMLNNTYRTITSTSDEESRDLITASIENEDMNFSLVSFTGMLEAGKSDGFTASNATYLEALNTIDGYIGDCLEAIKGREEAEKEDWLVVITSGHGGKADGSWGGASQQERNALCIFYYDHYSSVEMKGETLYGVLFDRNNSARLADPDQLYSAGEGRSLSVEFLARFELGPTGNYESGWEGMIRKRSWSIHRQGTAVIFRMEPGENGINAIQKNFTNIKDSRWHSYQLGIDAPTRTTKNFVMLYDGEISLREGSNTAGYIEDTNDLEIGGTGVPTPYYIAELRIWDKMLDDKTYADLNSQLNIPSTHPQYKHLVGYWKFTPDQLLDDGNTFKNQIEGMPDMVFDNTPRLAEFANTLPAQQKSGNLIMENTMIVPQILYWLNVGQVSTMDGFSFIDNFNHEEEWRQQGDSEKHN